MNISFMENAKCILQEAVHEHKPSGVYTLFSGGYDSLCCTHITAQHPLFQGVIHINTGIGIEQTRQFVRDTCKAYGWPLLEYHSPCSYEEIILQHGFPGPKSHLYMYTRLKERALDKFVREHKKQRHDRLILAAGARKNESKRRMGKALKIRRDGASVWVNPLFEWSKGDVLDYKEANHLPNNEVVDLLHMSGECLCGAFAKPGELSMIKALYPDTFYRIHTLQEKASAAGFPWGWEEGPPSWWKQIERGQEYLDGFAPLCSSCEANGKENSMTRIYQDDEIIGVQAQGDEGTYYGLSCAEAMFGSQFRQDIGGSDIQIDGIWYMAILAGECETTIFCKRCSKPLRECTDNPTI